MKIPRTAKVLKVTFLTDTSYYRKGDFTTVEKRDNGMWSNGEFSFFVSMLRNDNICKIEVIE